MERWSGRVALVTGASWGVGAELCRALVYHGMVVVGIARRVDKIRALAEEDRVKFAAGKLVALKCDITQEREISSVFDEIRQTFGRLDVCINNAGPCYNSPLLTGTTVEFKDMLNVNIMALCICTREAVKLMREKGIDDGQIINISSMAGHRLNSSEHFGIHFYSGTKFMVRALTEGLRRELKASNSYIRIGSISPGLVETESLDLFQSKDPTLKVSDDISSKKDPTPKVSGDTSSQKDPPLKVTEIKSSKKDPTLKVSDDISSKKILQVQDIAKSVLYILSAPPHVEVHDILLRTYHQTS